jgi:hypothetical protein
VNGVKEAGQVDVIYGSAPGLSTSAHAVQRVNQITAGTAIPPSNHGRYGSSLSAWNFGKNEFTNLPFTIHVAGDLAVGAEGETVSGVVAAGMANVLYGSFFSNGLVSTGNQVFTLQSFRISLGAYHFGKHARVTSRDCQLTFLML